MLRKWFGCPFQYFFQPIIGICLSSHFTSLCYSADGRCLLAGGRSKFVCLYDVLHQVLLKKFQTSRNRSFEGIQVINLTITITLTIITLSPPSSSLSPSPSPSFYHHHHHYLHHHPHLQHHPHHDHHLHHHIHLIFLCSAANPKPRPHE